jgi:transcriptional regulator with XRE-family HTH domain
MTVNEKWFREALTRAGKSQRDLAKFMDLDPSSLTHAFKGRRRLQLDEAQKIASFVGEQVEDVLKAAGVKLGRSTAVIIEHTPQVPVIGEVDATGVVTIPEKEYSVSGVSTLPADVVAVRLRSVPSLGNAVVFVAPGGDIDPEAIGRLSMVTLAGSGQRRVCKVDRGIDRGQYALTFLDGSQSETKISAAAPVLYIRP